VPAEAVGSRRVVLPGLRELLAFGLIDWRRFPKRHVIGLSDRWRTIATATQGRHPRAAHAAAADADAVCMIAPGSRCATLAAWRTSFNASCGEMKRT
jgi:hypothetical protein